MINVDHNSAIYLDLVVGHNGHRNRAVTGCLAAHAATALGARSWWVSIAVLAMGNSEIGVVGFILDARWP